MANGPVEWRIAGSRNEKLDGFGPPRENVYGNAATFWMVNWSGSAGALPPEATLNAVYVPGAVVPRKRLCHPRSGAKALKPQEQGIAVNDAPAVPNWKQVV